MKRYIFVFAVTALFGCEVTGPSQTTGSLRGDAGVSPKDAAGSDLLEADAQGVDSRQHDAELGDSTADSSSRDSQPRDGHNTDPRSPDSQHSTDARGPDARSTDARGPDARGPDARTTDARTTDTRGPDARSTDARSTDSSRFDGSSPDHTSTDSARADAGQSDGAAGDASCLPCGNISFLGQCNGSQLLWCNNSNCLHQIDCSGGMTPLHCGHFSDSWGYDCLAGYNQACNPQFPQPPSDPTAADYPGCDPSVGSCDPSTLRCGYVQDAGSTDVARPDTHQPDLSQPDAAQPDAALPDTALPDTALPDTALPDTALPDTALPDTWSPDTWSDDATAMDAGLEPPLPNVLGLDRYQEIAVCHLASTMSQTELEQAGLSASLASDVIAQRQTQGPYWSAVDLSALGLGQPQLSALANTASTEGIVPFCGDGLVQPGIEDCDPQTEYNRCSPQCRTIWEKPLHCEFGRQQHCRTNTQGLSATGIVHAMRDSGAVNEIAVDHLGYPHFVIFEDKGSGGEGRPIYFRWTGLGFEVKPFATTSSYRHGRYISLDVDNQGRPHIAYTAYQTLRYTTQQASGDWLTEDVETDDFIAFLTLRLTTAGVPYISYKHDEHDDVKLAQRQGPDSWILTTLETRHVAGWMMGMAVGPDDCAHVVYTESYHTGYENVHQLRYTTNCTESTASLLLRSGFNGFVDVATDAAGRPHYVHYANGLIRHGAFTGSQEQRYNDSYWNSETVYNDGTENHVARKGGIAFTSTGMPVVTFFDGDSQDLKIGYREGSTWHVKTLDSSARVGKRSSLAIDAFDRAHISYFDETNGAVKYLTFMLADLVDDSLNSCGDGLWQPGLEQCDDANSSSGDGCSALCQIENPGPVKPSKEHFFDFEVPGTGSTIAVDATGQPHVAFVSEGELVYASHNGAWQTQVVGPAHAVRSTVKVGSDGLPRIFYAPSESSVALATLSNGAWTINTVDSGISELASGPSMALDSNNRPYVCYVDESYREDGYYGYLGDQGWQLKTTSAVYRCEVGISSDDTVYYTFKKTTGSLDLLQGYSNSQLDYGLSSHASIAISDGDVWVVTSNSSYDETSVYRNGSQVISRSSVLRPRGHYPSAAFVDGQLHFVYYDKLNQDLLLLQRGINGVAGNSFSYIRAVDYRGDVGSHASLAAGPDNTLHVVYYDATLGHTKYWRQTP